MQQSSREVQRTVRQTANTTSLAMRPRHVISIKCQVLSGCTCHPTTSARVIPKQRLDSRSPTPLPRMASLEKGCPRILHQIRTFNISSHTSPPSRCTQNTDRQDWFPSSTGRRACPTNRRRSPSPVPGPALEPRLLRSLSVPSPRLETPETLDACVDCEKPSAPVVSFPSPSSSAAASSSSFLSCPFSSSFHPDLITPGGTEGSQDESSAYSCDASLRGRNVARG